MEANVVLSRIQEAINSEEAFQGLFEAFDEGMHEEHGFWFVPIRLTSMQPTARRMELYAKFAELEEYLQRVKNLKVLLLPVLSKQIA